MRWSVALAVGAACWISLGGTARASGGDAILPTEAAYVLVGIGALAVGSTVVFTALDVTYGVQLEPLPKRVAIAETACSGLQLALLLGTKLGRGAMSKNDYVLAYGLWSHTVIPAPITVASTRLNLEPVPARRRARHLMLKVAVVTFTVPLLF